MPFQLLVLFIYPIFCYETIHFHIIIGNIVLVKIFIPIISDNVVFQKSPKEDEINDRHHQNSKTKADEVHSADTMMIVEHSMDNGADTKKSTKHKCGEVDVDIDAI